MFLCIASKICYEYFTVSCSTFIPVEWPNPDMLMARCWYTLEALRDRIPHSFDYSVFWLRFHFHLHFPTKHLGSFFSFACHRSRKKLHSLINCWLAVTLLSTTSKWPRLCLGSCVWHPRWGGATAWWIHRPLLQIGLGSHQAGYNFCFNFNAFWSLDGRSFHLVNDALLVLPRTKSDADSIKDYRPISLMHSFCKMITECYGRAGRA
jgi:hypothetical protein